MNLKHIEAFYWLCQLETYQRVAERLNITQPAVSARVRALESLVGVPLIDRGRADFALTERGVETLSLAERMLDLRTTLLEGATGVGQHSRIRIAAVSLTVKTWMPMMLATIRQTFPDTPCDLVSASDHQLARYMPTADIDLAFLSNAPPSMQISRLFTVNYEVRWIAHPDLLPKAGPVTPQELAHLPVIHYPRTSPLFPLTSELESDGSASQHSSNSLGTLIWMLKQGLGIAAIPAVSVEEELAAGMLKVIDTQTVPRVLKVRCAYANMARKERVAQFLDIAYDSARAFCQSHPLWCQFVADE
ncbi:MAG: LysR family transcriptional regulator [Devosiaceae bacterium]|nr:LysR family transcriptional regulator [Devosiaceae bacterium MH13]